MGHAFLLGRKYTELLKTTYLNSKGKHEIMEMGCYGIGVTRLLAGVIEALSSDDHIKWPISIVPYFAAILPPKVGSQTIFYSHNSTFFNKNYAYDLCCSYNLIIFFIFRWEVKKKKWEEL